MNINELTAKFQQHLRDEGLSTEQLEGTQDNWGYVWTIKWEESDFMYVFEEFLKQMINESLIEIK